MAERVMQMAEIKMVTKCQSGHVDERDSLI